MLKTAARISAEMVPVRKPFRTYLRFWPGFVAAVVATALLTLHLMGRDCAKVDTFELDDVGIIYTLARMNWAEGAVAYRDFILDYGPAYFWFLGPFFRLASLDNMMGAIALSTDVVCWFLAPLGIYLVSWRLLRRSLPAWGSLLLHLSLFMTFLDIRLVAIIYALLAIQLLKDRGPLLHSVIGAVIAAAWLTGIQSGVFPGYCYALTMLYRATCAAPRRMPWRQVGVRVAGLAAGLALVLAVYVGCYLRQGGRLDPLLYTWFVRGPINSAAHKLPFLFGADTTTRLYTFCRLTPLLCLLPIFFLVFSDPGRRDRADYLTWALGVLVVQLYGIGRADIGHVCIAATLFAPAFAYMIWNRHRLCLRGDARDGLLLAGWLSLVAAEFAVFFHNEALGKFQPLVMLLAVLLIVVAERRGHASSVVPSWRISLLRWGVTAAILAPLAYAPLERVSSFAHLVLDVARDPGDGARRLAAAPPPADDNLILGMRFRPEQVQAIRRLCQRLNAEPALRDNPYVYIFPNHCFLYNLLRAKNPTPQYLWAFIVSEREDRQTVRALEQRRPPFVILNDILAPSSSSIINLYVLRHYVLDHIYGEYYLYRRYDGKPRPEEMCLTSRTGNFTPLSPYPPEIRRSFLQGVAGHPDQVLARPPAAGRFLWQRCHWPKGELTSMRVRIEAAGPAKETGAATVKAVRQDDSEELLAALTFEAGGSRAHDVNVPIWQAENIKSLVFDNDLAHGAYWQIEANCRQGDPARAVNWSRMHYAFVKYTSAKEYDYANYIKTVTADSDAVFVHPPHGFVFAVQRGAGAGDQLLDGLSALEIHCSPLPAPTLPGLSLARVVLHRLDGQQQILWLAPTSFPGPAGWDISVKLEHAETIARIEFASAFSSGTYWKIVGLYDGALDDNELTTGAPPR